jgi:catechol 2,3-dioxygenase-like lactoylglutathione lyase family enzyme
MTVSPRLAHCMMMVSDLERAIGFYGAVMNFNVVDRHRYEGHDLAYMRSPGSDIEIELVKPDTKEPAIGTRDESWHLAFTVGDLDREFARLSALGVRLDPIDSYVANGTFQTRYFYFYDPDGHQIEFLEARGRYASEAIDASAPKGV